MIVESFSQNCFHELRFLQINSRRIRIYNGVEFDFHTEILIVKINTMKKISSLIIISALCITQSCNNSDSNKDSVATADSVNEKKDTTSMTEKTKDSVTATTMPVNDDVAKFAVKVANAGMAEVQLGKLAEEKGQPKV